METWDGLPIREIPPDILGKTKRFRQQNIVVCCQGVDRKIGWLLFGKKDKSFYIYQSGKSPVIQVGTAILKNGKFVKQNSMDVTDLPLDIRAGTHLSLHPTGEAHVKSGANKCLTVANIGQWLPVRQPFTFAYWFTAPVGTLSEANTAGRAFEVADPSKSLRLDIIISPLQRRAEKAYVPYYTNTMFLGWSPHYAVLLNAVMVPACEPCLFFLASPSADDLPGE